MTSTEKLNKWFPKKPLTEHLWEDEEIQSKIDNVSNMPDSELEHIYYTYAGQFDMSMYYLSDQQDIKNWDPEYALYQAVLDEMDRRGQFEPAEEEVVVTEDVDDVTDITVEEPAVDETIPQTGTDMGVSTLVTEVLTQLLSMADFINGVVATVQEKDGSADVIDILNTVSTREHENVGMLQKALEYVNPKAEAIENGKQEVAAMESKKQSNGNVITESDESMFATPLTMKQVKEAQKNHDVLWFYPDGVFGGDEPFKVVVSGNIVGSQIPLVEVEGDDPYTFTTIGADKLSYEYKFEEVSEEEMDFWLNHDPEVDTYVPRNESLNTRGNVKMVNKKRPVREGVYRPSVDPEVNAMYTPAQAAAYNSSNRLAKRANKVKADLAKKNKEELKNNKSVYDMYTDEKYENTQEVTESVIRQLKRVSRQLTEGRVEMTPEEAADNKKIQRIIRHWKDTGRINPKLTDSDREVLNKYGIDVDSMSVGNTPIFFGQRDSGKYNMPKNPNKINFVDRAKKAPERDRLALGGRNSREHNDNRHFPWQKDEKGWNYQEHEREVENRRLRKPYKDMQYAIGSRFNAIDDLNTVNSRKAYALSNAETEYQDKINYINRRYSDEIESNKSKLRNANDTIDTLLKRKKNESMRRPVNRRLRESSNEIARKGFVSLNKDKWGYRILNDGYFVVDVFAKSDEEAIDIFHKFLTTNWSAAWRQDRLPRYANDWLENSFRESVNRKPLRRVMNESPDRPVRRVMNEEQETDKDIEDEIKIALAAEGKNTNDTQKIAKAKRVFKKVNQGKRDNQKVSAKKVVDNI